MAAIYNVTVHETNTWTRRVIADSEEQANFIADLLQEEEGFEYFEEIDVRLSYGAEKDKVLTYDQFLKEYHDRAVDLFNYVEENGYECWVTTHIMLGIEMLEKAYPQYYVQIKGTRILGHKCWDLIELSRPNKKPSDLVSDQPS